MANTPHASLTQATGAVHPAAYVQSSDPGAVGAHKFWVDTTGSAPFQLKKRNAANSAWENIGVISSLTDPTTTRGDLITRGVAVLGRLAAGATNTLLGSNGTDPAWTAAPVVSGELTALDLKASGMTGAANAVRIVGGNASGAPASGTFALRDLAIDSDGTIWICTSAGSPGSWTQVSGAGGGGGGGVGTSSSLIYETTLGSASATINTGTLNTNFRDLRVVVVGRGDTAAQSTGLRMRFNADAGATYNFQNHFAAGTSNTASSSTGQTTATIGDMTAASATTSFVTVAEIFIPNYNGTTFFKDYQSAAFLASSTIQSNTHRGWWANTAAITSIQLSLAAGNFLTGTVVRVYGEPSLQQAFPYIKIEDQKTSGTAGGTFTTGAWRTRDLNTEVEDTHALAALATNQITLAAGTYRVAATAPAEAVGQHQLRVQDITNTITLALGQNAPTQSVASVAGRFVLGGTAAIELQHRCVTTVSTSGFGGATSWGTEVYGVIEVWKEA